MKPHWPTIHITEITEQDDILVESVLTSPVCDYCGDLGPCWDYDCHQFDIEEIGFGSLGEWAACSQCSELIEAGDYDGLLERTVSASPETGERLRELIRAIHYGFRIDRIGERIAWG